MSKSMSGRSMLEQESLDRLTQLIRWYWKHSMKTSICQSMDLKFDPCRTRSTQSAQDAHEATKCIAI